MQPSKAGDCHAARRVLAARNDIEKLLNFLTSLFFLSISLPAGLVYNQIYLEKTNFNNDKIVILITYKVNKNVWKLMNLKNDFFVSLHHAFWSSISLLLVSACSISTPSPAPKNTLIPQKTETLSPTPTLTQTTIPFKSYTPSPYPTLSPQGPYLVLNQDKENGDKPQKLIILNADGHGKRVLELPEGGYVRHLQKAVSPDGRFVAFHLAHRGWGLKPRLPSELSLNLLDLSNGEVQLVTTLLSKDYLADLEKSYKLLHDYPPESFLSYQFSFEGGIFSLSWSPNGRYLAFAGAMESGSSDMYLYDVETKTIQRKTAEPLNITWIEWSPDGKWILYTSVTPEGEHGIGNLHRTRPNSTVITNPEILVKGWWHGIGWLNDQSYLVIHHGDGDDPFYLHYVNIVTKQDKDLWQDPCLGYAFDPGNELLAVSGYKRGVGEMVDLGTYLIRLDGKQQKISSNDLYQIVFRGGSKSRFLGFDSKKVMSISKDGIVTQLSDKPFENASVSPDLRWVVLYQESEFSHEEIVGADLYSENDQFVRAITDQAAFPIWSPDSTGLFLLTDALYYMAIPNGELVSIDDCDNCEEDFVWIP